MIGRNVQVFHKFIKNTTRLFHIKMDCKFQQFCANSMNGGLSLKVSSHKNIVLIILVNIFE
jgi:hypothetical protein